MSIFQSRSCQNFGKTLRHLCVAAVIALPLAGCNATTGGGGLQLVGDAEAEKMGADAWSEIQKETKPSTNTAMQARARAISDKLLIAAGENPKMWDVQVFQSKEANAFALPGRKIGVFEGLMDLADDDAMLAAVIGHEIAHVELSHSQSRMSNQIATNVGAGLADVVLGQGWGQIVGLGAQYGLLMPYGRGQELEADHDGLFYMARAGYDPRQSVTFWQKMSAQGGSQMPAFLSTHPGHDDRIAQLQRLMPHAITQYENALARAKF